MSDTLSNAEIHAKIAAKVYPDAKIMTDDYGVLTNAGPVFKGHRTCHNRFNLLEAYEGGNPTQQAKASALDVLVWLETIPGDGSPFKNMAAYAIATFEITPSAIYEVAKEIVE